MTRARLAPVEPPMPTEIRVGPYTCAVQLVPAMQSWGYINYTEQTISISADCPYRRRASALLHEVLHAVTEACGMDDRFGKMDEEDAVLLLSPTLLRVLQENPQLVAYLVGAA